MRAKTQTAFVFKTWGGKRKNAGRPRQGDKRVPHLPRPLLAKRFPVIVTVRMKQGTFSLRSRRSFSQLAKAFYAANDRFGMRLCHFSVLANHIHFLVEAQDKQSLSRAMQGLGIRIARALHRVMGKRGPVYADRYHARILRTPTEVRNARHYVLQNARRHKLMTGSVDPYSSVVRADPVVAPRTWLLGVGRRAPPPDRLCSADALRRR